MMMSRNRARAVAIARTRNDNLLTVFRLSMIAAGAVATLLALLF
ncbi:hypothetical protein [Agrobacterium larrymoorei]